MDLSQIEINPSNWIWIG